MHDLAWTNDLARTTWLGPTPEAARSSTFIRGLPRCGTTSASYTLQTSALVRELRSEVTRPPKMRSYLRKLHVTN